MRVIVRKNKPRGGEDEDDNNNDDDDDDEYRSYSAVFPRQPRGDRSTSRVVAVCMFVNA